MYSCELVGSSETLYRSVHDKIFSLPENFLLYPGHDYTGTYIWCIHRSCPGCTHEGVIMTCGHSEHITRPVSRACNHKVVITWPSHCDHEIIVVENLWNQQCVFSIVINCNLLYKVLLQFYSCITFSYFLEYFVTVVSFSFGTDEDIPS